MSSIVYYSFGVNEKQKFVFKSRKHICPIMGSPKVRIPARKSDALTQTYLWSFVVGSGIPM